MSNSESQDFSLKRKLANEEVPAKKTKVAFYQSNEVFLTFRNRKSELLLLLFTEQNKVLLNMFRSKARKKPSS